MILQFFTLVVYMAFFQFLPVFRHTTPVLCANSYIIPSNKAIISCTLPLYIILRHCGFLWGHSGLNINDFVKIFVNISHIFDVLPLSIGPYTKFNRVI